MPHLKLVSFCRIAQRIHKVGGRSGLVSMRTGDNASLHAIDVFLDGVSWGEVPVIVHLDAPGPSTGVTQLQTAAIAPVGKSSVGVGAVRVSGGDTSDVDGVLRIGDVLLCRPLVPHEPHFVEVAAVDL